MTIVLDRAPETATDGAGSKPPTTTTVAYDMYDAGDYKKGDRVALRPEFDAIATVDTARVGTVVRVDTDGSAFPIVVWLDEFGRQSAAEAAGEVGMPVCAGDIYRVDDL